MHNLYYAIHILAATPEPATHIASKAKQIAKNAICLALCANHAILKDDKCLALEEYE